MDRESRVLQTLSTGHENWLGSRDARIGYALRERSKPKKQKAVQGQPQINVSADGGNGGRAISAGLSAGEVIAVGTSSDDGELILAGACSLSTTGLPSPDGSGS